MKKLFLHCLGTFVPAVLLLTTLCGQSVTLKSDPQGHRIMVNNQPFFIKGMNWDYFPIGTNYNYSLWDQPDDIIMAALDAEMSLLKDMGVNAVRQYTGVPAKWISYIYDKYGIYTMLNHSFGRYGLTIDGTWMGITDYADPRVRVLLLQEVTQLVESYQNTRGLLMFLLGNENNYGLFWDGAETEDIPVEDRKSTVRAQAMYQLFNEATVAMKKVSKNHPIAICNGDLLFLDLINKYCPDVDILGVNMYRGVSFGDAFSRAQTEYGKPIMFTEFGADAFNVKSNGEDQVSQAYYMVGNWKEIYANAYGMQGVGNSIGGFTFQFSDGWWKYGQTDNLDIHDANASWSNGGYLSDFTEGENNMNEEWFGICAKGPNDERGLYQLFPRAAYYALKEVHSSSPLDANMNASMLNSFFDNISLSTAEANARGDKAALEINQLNKVRVSRFTADFSTFNTGGSLVTTPEEANPNVIQFPNQRGFDHMQSFIVGVEATPAPNMRANVELNVLGNVAQNPINELFYENRGRPVNVSTPNGPVTLSDQNRLAVYRAEFTWNQKYFDLEGFYRTGHYHWGYEGDFFGLYPEANYGPNIDIYNGVAPVGVEIEGKKVLKGLTLAMGPELWWGANPALLLKYSKQVGGVSLTGVFHEDIEQRTNTESSFAIPQPKTRRATLHAKTTLGKIGLEAGGIWGGEPLVGRSFQLLNENDPTDNTLYEDVVNSDDTWGGKVKLTYMNGRFKWYGQAAAMSLVANGGADLTQTFTGWRLKDSGSGNQYNFLSGFTMRFGDFEIAPNFLWQKPLVGPVTLDAGEFARPRNIISDPFVVRANRETTAGELLLTYDPTPATWMYQWNNDEMEDAAFAANIGFVYRSHPTVQDAAIGILPDGRSTFAFAASAPAANLWEAYTRIVSKLNANTKIISNIYTGTAQANGDSDRTIHRTGLDIRMVHRQVKVAAMAQFNDWGPYDYHRDFNLTFPQQYTLDVSTFLGKSNWVDLSQTRIGVQGIYRTLNQFSPRYCPTSTINAAGNSVCVMDAQGFGNGAEWQVMSYVRINVFQ